MSLKLRLASIYTPKSTFMKELEELNSKTTLALQDLLEEYGSDRGKTAVHPLPNDSLEEKRSAMARTHNELVLALTEAVGREKAIELGRTRLFEVGRDMGRRIRTRLGVSDDIDDVIRAARVIYKVLGIRFDIRNDDQGTSMVVYHCALSKFYAPDTCQILSAADEGVVQGLSPSIKMRFMERMTSGQRNCRAIIDASELREVGG